MKLLLCVLVSGPLLLPGCARGDRAATDAVSRTVAFDNVYGQVDRLAIHVSVDGGAERPLTATCDRRICTFEVPLTDGRHELAISVEQNGRRSAPARVTLDTTNPR